MIRSDQIEGVVSMRWREAERLSRVMLPGTRPEPCERCGEKVAVTPAMRAALFDLQKQPWCYECVEETHPEGYGRVVSLATIIEAITLDRIERELARTEGPVH